MRGDFAMKVGQSRKKGFTLVEVLVVVVIMGILSSMGVVSIAGAVANARVKDYAQNTAAFFERIANDANRMSKPLCIKIDRERRNPVFLVYTDAACETDLYDSLVLETPARYDCVSEFEDDLFESFCQNEGSDNSDWSNGVFFRPRIGLSAAPSKMSLCIQYGDDRVFGGIVKCANKNMILPLWNSGDAWLSL